MSRKIIPLALLLSLATLRVDAAGPDPGIQPSPDSRFAANTATVSPARELQAKLAATDASLVGTGQPGDCKSGKGDASCRQVYVQAEALFWDRIGTGCDQLLAFDSYTNEALLNTNDLEFDYEPGLRVLVGWQPDPCRGCGWCSAWELSYFGVYDWNASAAALGDNSLSIPGDAGLLWNNFGLADEIRAVYDSELHNVEMNCVKSCCFDCGTRIDFLCGFRFITLLEDFSLIGTDLQEGTSSYDVSTENYLYGLQFGGRLRRSWQRWAVELTGKAGVFLNDASQSQMATDFPDEADPNVVRALTGSDEQSVAALGEIGVTLIRPITDVWSLRIGYQALGIGGLALAPNQLDFTDTFTSGSELRNDGYVFLHGVNVGVEAYW